MNKIIGYKKVIICIALYFSGDIFLHQNSLFVLCVIIRATKYVPVISKMLLMLTVIWRALTVCIRRRLVSSPSSLSLRRCKSQPRVTSSRPTVATRASGSDATTALAARGLPTVASRAASVRRAATGSATPSAPRPSAAPTDATTPACVSCGGPPAAYWRTSRRNTTENAVRIALSRSCHIHLLRDERRNSEHSFLAVKHTVNAKKIWTSVVYVRCCWRVVKLRSSSAIDVHSSGNSNCWLLLLRVINTMARRFAYTLK